MKKHTIVLSLAAGLLIGLLAVTIALAQTNAYTLDWWTVDGGGGTISGGGYTLAGTAGQPESGAALNGGGYTLTSGFWANDETTANSLNKIYLPLVLR